MPDLTQGLLRHFLFENPTDLAEDEKGTSDTVYSQAHVVPVVDPQRCNVALFMSDTQVGTPGGHTAFTLTPSMFSGGQGWTVAYWWKGDQDPGGSTNILTGYGACQWLHLYHAVDPNGTMWNYNCGGNACNFSAGAGVWRHYAGSYNAQTTAIMAYVDGNPYTCATAGGSPNFSFVALALNGVYETPTLPMVNRGATGHFDDVRVYSRALSDSDVRLLYDNGKLP